MQADLVDILAVMAPVRVGVNEYDFAPVGDGDGSDYLSVEDVFDDIRWELDMEALRAIAGK